MEIKDTLTLYNELKNTGIPEDQAQIQAKQLGSVYDLVKNININLSKIDKDLFWMRIIGGAMVASFMANVIWK